MKLRLLGQLILGFLVVTTAQAQGVRVGGLDGGTHTFISGTTLTVIDWSRPTTGTGALTTATVAWEHADVPCDNIFYLRFFAIPPNSLGTTAMTAERGPFRAVNGLNTVTLTPPVNATNETYLGIYRAAGADSCGSPYGVITRNPGRALFASNADFKGGALTSLGPAMNFALQAEGTSGASTRIATLPAVASAAGGNGSFFRTSMSVSNPSTLPIHGKFVLRKAGQAGSSSDPSLDFELASRATLNYDDIMASMNQSGLGSLDIYTTGSPTPLVNARVFNDAGEEGTSGFFEDAVPAGRPYNATSVVLIPTDLTKFRLNIGVRTIDAANLNVEVFDAGGARTTTLVKNYTADYFEQVTASQFLNGAEVPPGGKIVVSVFVKEFIVYGAVTDNKTNDPSMRIGLD